MTERQFNQAVQLINTDGWVKLMVPMVEQEIHACRTLLEMTAEERQRSNIPFTHDLLVGKLRGLTWASMRLKFMMDEYLLSKQDQEEVSNGDGAPQGVGSPYIATATE